MRVNFQSPHGGACSLESGSAAGRVAEARKASAWRRDRFTRARAAAGRFLSILLLLALCACGGIPRIQKLPVPREQQLEAFQLMHEGDQLLREGKDHLAMLKYLEASRANPYHEAIFNKLGIAYSRLQMFPQAENAVNRSIGLNRSYPYAHNTKGIVELSKSNYRGAARFFSRAIELKPTVANFYLNLGYSLVQDGKFEEGLAAYQKGLDLQPEVLEQAAFIEISHAVNTEKDFRPRRLFDMARLFARLGQLERCIEYLGRAISAGFTDIESIYREEDFRQVRDTEEFERFMTQAGLTD